MERAPSLSSLKWEILLYITGLGWCSDFMATGLPVYGPPEHQSSLLSLSH